MKRFITFQFTISGKKYIFQKESKMKLAEGTEYSPAGKELYAGIVKKFKFNEKTNVFITCIVNDYEHNKEKPQVPFEFIEEMMKEAGWKLLPDEPDDLDV